MKRNDASLSFSIFDIKAIIGLGNPGVQYYKNRHSIGFRVVDELVQRVGCLWQEDKQMAYTSMELSKQEELSSHTIYLVKPLTFMNTVGKVIPWCLKKGITASQILVVHDELEKKFGSVTIRFGGSARGHNGLRSIIGVLGYDFWRLRFGIGRPEKKEEVSNYVLFNFPVEQEEQIDELIDKAIDMLGIFSVENCS